MIKKLLIQSGTCLLLILSFLLAEHSGIEFMQSGTETVLDHMSVSYTMDDVKTAAGKTAQVFNLVTGKASDAVNAMSGKPVYGTPIDEEYEGSKAVVYAVGGGKVTAVGENEEIGKYVRIIHGDQAESLYGNLDIVRVSAPDYVKKGQIIGIYEKKEGKDFYYSFKEF